MGDKIILAENPVLLYILYMVANLNRDPYADLETDEERQAVYEKLLEQYEQDEFERRKTVYTDLIDDWKLQRSIQQDLDQRSHKSLLTIAAGSFGVSFAFISQEASAKESGAEN